MKRYYDFTLKELGDLSPYQFNSFMDEIPETIKMLSGGKPKSEGSTKIEDLIDMARKKGVKTPTKY